MMKLLDPFLKNSGPFSNSCIIYIITYIIMYLLPSFRKHFTQN